MTDHTTVKEMKRILYYIQQVFLVTLVVATGFLFETTVAAIAGGAVMSAGLTGLLVKAFSDPQTKQLWETQAFRMGEEKTEFNEMEIGTEFTNDGPRPSDISSAPPILYHNELEGGGRKVNIRYNQPLKEGVTEIMNAGRLANQDRLGHEEKMEVQHVTAFVDIFHLGVREDEVELGDQNTANMGLGDVVSAFVEKMSDFHAKRKDYGLFYGFFARYDLHAFKNAAIRKNVSHGSQPVDDTDGGLLSPPREHPNIYVWYKENDTYLFSKVDYDDTAATHSNNINTEASKITPDAKPGLNLLYRIRRTCERKNMIPNRVRLQDGLLHKYFLVYMPGRMKDILEQDEEVRKLYNSAYQGFIDRNPMLQQGDLVWKNLIIRDSNVLENEEFTYKYNFNVEGGDSSDDAAFEVAGSDIKTGDVKIAFGERTFAAESPAAGEDGFTPDQIGRIMVMGANSTLKVSGKQYELEPMEVSEYGLNAGLGQTHFFGNQLVVRRKTSSNGLIEPTAPQSFQVLAFMGDM